MLVLEREPRRQESISVDFFCLSSCGLFTELLCSSAGEGISSYSMISSEALHLFLPGSLKEQKFLVLDL